MALPPFKDVRLKATQSDSTPPLITNSPAMHAVVREISRVASNDMPVLITGEVGTGKKLVARTIHENSGRSGAPFIATNCSTSAASVIDLELFGRVRGSTLGRSGRRGLLERAAGGTALLEEIGSLSEVSQGLLLCLLATKELTRLGDHKPIGIDVRLVTTATLADPRAVAAPTLRSDLYSRLSTIRLHLPPLRERSADIEPLASYLLQWIAGRVGREVRCFSPEATAALCHHPWPGNGRELIRVLEWAVALSRGTRIERDDLFFETPVPLTPDPVQPITPLSPGSAAELALLLETLKRVQFSFARAALELKIPRTKMYQMLRRNGLNLREDVVVLGP
jgi:DNA-binding NtrC family response regulator